MTLYFDTEFTGLHKNTTLISIGIVSKQGHIFYAELTDYDTNQVTEWISNNVLKHQILNQQAEVHTQQLTLVKGTRTSVSTSLKKWLEQFEQIEFLGDVYMYDWILFCELFGGALQLPSNISYIPIDFASLLWLKGIDPKISREQLVNEGKLASNLASLPFKLSKHNALYDAILLKVCFDSFMEK